jgi:ketosteroid isomerase-like protein
MTATQSVRDFFDAYRDHDVERMVDLCREDAEFSAVPVELWGRQRVVRGDGWVRTVGKVLWTGFIDAFPDLTNRVTSLTADGDGNVAAEVVLSGSQAREWGTIGNRALRFALPHLFVFRVDDQGLIARIVAYWDDAHLRQQLGTLEVD